MHCTLCCILYILCDYIKKIKKILAKWTSLLHLIMSSVLMYFLQTIFGFILPCCCCTIDVHSLILSACILTHTGLDSWKSLKKCRAQHYHLATSSLPSCSTQMHESLMSAAFGAKSE